MSTGVAPVVAADASHQDITMMQIAMKMIIITGPMNIQCIGQYSLHYMAYSCEKSTRRMRYLRKIALTQIKRIG
jgi:hypothetical protein